MEKHHVDRASLTQVIQKMSLQAVINGRDGAACGFGDGGEAFDSILSNPNLPESFKERIKEMQKRQKEQREKRKVD